MKTFARVVRRYVLATAAVILLLMLLSVVAMIALGYYYGTVSNTLRYSSSRANLCSRNSPRKPGWKAMPGPWCWMTRGR